MNKPVAAVSMLEHGIYYLTVVCEDGSVWQHLGSRWQELDPVPGTERYLEQAREEANAR